MGERGLLYGASLLFPTFSPIGLVLLLCSLTPHFHLIYLLPFLLTTFYSVISFPSYICFLTNKGVAKSLMEPKKKKSVLVGGGGGQRSDATGAVLSTLWSWSAACHLVFPYTYFSFGDSHICLGPPSPQL